MAIFSALGNIFLGHAAAEETSPVPGWLQEHVESQSALLGGLLSVKRQPFFKLSYDPSAHPQGVRVIDAEATDETITIRYEGAWAEPSRLARRDATRNLAHEFAHLRQRALGLPTENRFFHEGFAEAMAIAGLAACGAPCDGEPGALLHEAEGRCAKALQYGPLMTQSSDADAVYGCGAILMLTAARKSDIPVDALYGEFAKTERRFEDFLTLLEEKAGKRFVLSVRAFWRGDYHLVPASQVIADLRRGRL